MAKLPHEFTLQEMRDELATMTDRELAAYHTILIMNRRCIQSDADRELDATHFALIAEIATQRHLI